MVIVQINNVSGEPVGEFNTENYTYYRDLYWEKDHIMKLPKYEKGSCISKSILKKLIILSKGDAYKIKFEWTFHNVPDYPAKFTAIATYNDFTEFGEDTLIKGWKGNLTDAQVMLRIRYWKILDKAQLILPEIKSF